MDWSNESGITDFSGNQGFIYRLDYEGDYVYYGKKDFIMDIKTPLGKKVLELQTDKRLKNYKRVQKESNWRKYEGSHDSSGYVLIKKSILAVYETKRELTFREVEILIKKNALFDQKCLNKNILGKFFRNVASKKE